MEFQWAEEQNEAFNKLKMCLIHYPVLQLFNSNARVTQLHTDTNSSALTGMLLQGETEKELKLVCNVSKHTTEAERMYHSLKLELYAIVWCLERLRAFLLGIKFTVITDCQVLIYLNINYNTKAQITRWFDVIQDFDMKVKYYRSRTKLTHVDALNQVVMEDKAEGVKVVLLNKRYEVCTFLTLIERVQLMQWSDKTIRELSIY